MKRSPGSGDVLTLRTRSLISDDLWQHSIFRTSSKENCRNKYGHCYVRFLARARGHRLREREQMFSPKLSSRKARLDSRCRGAISGAYLSFHDSAVFLSTSSWFRRSILRFIATSCFSFMRVIKRAYQARYMQARNLPRRLNPT